MSRQEELERRYLHTKVANSPTASTRRKNQLSISDDSHHVTEAIGSWYEGEAMATSGGGGGGGGGSGVGSGRPQQQRDIRPLSYVNAPSERDSFEARRQRRHGTLLDTSITTPPTAPEHRASPTTRTPLARAQSNERLAVTPPPEGNGSISSPKSIQRMGSLGSENMNGPVSPPPLSRQSSSDTASQQFPLNDIDYESSAEAVKQELSNLNALRRMSMNIDNADPDLPSFSNIPTVAPKQSDDEDDPSKLFWVPARLHPELAPKEFKTFVEDRVDKIRRRSGGSDTLSPDGVERSGSGSSLQRKKSMLSRQIDTRGNYEDGAERLERKRSKGMHVEAQATVANLHDLEELVNDPAQLMRRMSLDTARRSQDSGVEVNETDDIPILPPTGPTLKRSTRTTYRRGSLRKGERVPFSRRAQQRQAETTDPEESPVSSPNEPPVQGLTRVQTEPMPPPSEPRENFSRPSKRTNPLGSSHSAEDLPAGNERDSTTSPPPVAREEREDETRQERPLSEPPSSQQPRQFQSRIASQGRTSAQLPGYNNTNPLPQIVETLPDGTKVPTKTLIQTQYPERKSSHEASRQFQRGGAHMRPVPGREKQQSLDDISSHPSPLPGSGNTRTDALTMVPTFEEKKPEKKEAPRKSSWKWILGSDDDKKAKAKEEAASAAETSSTKIGKQSKQSTDNARLDVLQTSIDGNTPARGRESIVLNREDLKLDEERKKESRKYSEPKKEKDGLLSAIFGGKKKTSDGDLKEKKRKSDRNNLSPEPAPRILKPDIDYNWTRFSILEERAIYRMAHIKLANPRRALYSQVLLSNFMYSYLAKVQMMHPQIQIPAAQRAAQQRGQKDTEQQQQPPEFNQYQRWQEQQAREQAAQQQASQSSKRTSFDMVHDGQQQAAYESSLAGHDRQSLDDHNGRLSYPPNSQQNGSGRSDPRTNGNGYSVASTHDYLGYSSNQKGLWDDEERSEELW